VTNTLEQWEELDLASTAFRDTMGLFPTGVALLTAGEGERFDALTVNSVISVSLVPLLVLVSLRRTTRILGQITEEEKSFTVNILAADQRHVASMFARSDRTRGTAAAALLGGTPARTGGMLISDALAAVHCELDQVCPAGDHDLVLGRVVAIHSGRTAVGPLVFHRGGYVNLPSADPAPRPPR
jgi:flavin reductase